MKKIKYRIEEKEGGALFFIDPNGVEISTIEIVEKRNFSVGYSTEETKRLRDSHAVRTKYNIHHGGIVKHIVGSYTDVGACKGYYIDTIRIDGIKSLGGWGYIDDAEKIIKEVRRLYREQ